MITVSFDSFSQTTKQAIDMKIYAFQHPTKFQHMVILFPGQDTPLLCIILYGRAGVMRGPVRLRC